MKIIQKQPSTEIDIKRGDYFLMKCGDNIHFCTIGELTAHTSWRKYQIFKLYQEGVTSWSDRIFDTFEDAVEYVKKCSQGWKYIPVKNVKLTYEVA